MKTNKDLADFERNIDYGFKNRALLCEALTHSSAINELHNESNQRMEFLGDAVLQLCVSTHIYRLFPEYDEGALSKLRSLLVCADSLYISASKVNLSEYIVLGKGEEHSGGRKKKNILADAFESLIGAVYLDGGFDAADRFIVKNHHEVIEKALAGNLTYDFKTTLQEYVQSHNMGHLEYRLLETKGPEHDRTFISCVVIDKKTYGNASGHNRKESEQNAAQNALIELNYFG